MYLSIDIKPDGRIYHNDCLHSMFGSLMQRLNGHTVVCTQCNRYANLASDQASTGTHKATETGRQLA